MPVKDVSIVSIISKYIELKPRGPHMVGNCPFHNDKTSSLIVTESKDMFKCFGCGESGDVVDFVMKKENIGYIAARDKVRDPNDIILKAPIKQPEPVRSEWHQIRPQWNPTFTHPEYGQPSKRWVFRDLDGAVIGYDLRFDLPDGQKLVMPYGFFTNGSIKSWRFQGFDAPRPLYNMDKLSHGKPVLIVEGCKTAKAGADLIGEAFTVVTWQGGANGVEKTSFKALKGLDVYLWPDNDKEARYGSKFHPKYDQLKPYSEQPGNAAMIQIGKTLKGVARSINWIPNRADWPNKWDLADWEGATSEMVLNYIKDNAKTFKG